MANNKVLLVEDEMQIRLNMKMMLEIEEYEVVDVNDGLEALAQLAIRSFDLIITDIMMQNMDGLELLKNVRANEQICHLPVIFVTAKPEKDIVDFIQHDKRNFYLGKPFSFNNLKLTAKKALNTNSKI